MDHFYAVRSALLYVFQFAPSECDGFPKKSVMKISFQALLHAYQEYHLTFELMTSQMEQSV